MEILLKDGVRYLPHIPKSEEKLEESVKEHAKEIFGEETLYFDVKKKLEAITGEKSIPDGYLINLGRKEFFLIEIELSSHPEYDHIQKQIGKFTQALQNYKTRQKIASALKECIEEDIVMKKFVIDRIGERDIYQFLLEEILEEVSRQEFQVIVIIDKKTPTLDGACGIIRPSPKIIEFKTYTREGVEGMKVHIHQFEPTELKPPPPPPPPPGRKRTPQRAFRLPILKTLIEMGGRGKAEKVIDEAGEKMEGILRRADYERLISGQVLRWRNTASWESNAMKNEGLIRKIKPYYWEITEKGRRYYEEYKKTQA